MHQGKAKAEQWQEFLNSNSMVHIFMVVSGMSSREMTGDVLRRYGIEAFAIWCPLLFNEYWRCAAGVWERLPDLLRPSSLLPFAAISVNFGPHTISIPHRDLANLAWGWCVIIVLGSFDGARGGHLLLHEAKLILEVWPGAIIFLPSASITHSNVPLADPDNEFRFSIILYSAGGLFRWLFLGGQTVTSLENESAAKKDYEDGAADRREKWVANFMSVAQLKEWWKAHGRD